jgi:hypothetical protein
VKTAVVVFALSFGVSAFAQSGASISVATPAPAAAPAAIDSLATLKMNSSASAPAPAKRRLTKKAIGKKKTKVREVVAPEVLESRAVHELMLPKDDLSVGVLPTPATVRSRVEEVTNPARPLEYRLGISIQPFSPKGSMPVTDLAPYNLADAGTNPMFAIEGQWLPLTFENVAGLKAGPFVSLGYAQFDLALRSPTGVQLEDTKLHAIKAQLGATASYELPQSPLWSLHGNLGVGRLQLIQSSASAAANTSSAINFASLGLSLERSLSTNFSAYVGYDLRLALNRITEGADVPNHNFLIGLLGNFE